MAHYIYDDGLSLGQELVWQFENSGVDNPVFIMMGWLNNEYIPTVDGELASSTLTDKLLWELNSVGLDSPIFVVMNMIRTIADEIDFEDNVDSPGLEEELWDDLGSFMMTGNGGSRWSVDLNRLTQLFPDDGMVFSELFSPAEFNMPVYCTLEIPPIIPGTSVYITLSLTQYYDMGIESSDDPAITCVELNSTLGAQEAPCDGSSHTVAFGAVASPPVWLNTDGSIVTVINGLYKISYTIQAGPSGA